MLTEERQQRILTELDRCGVVKLRDLVTLLDASESTVRRDLAELEEAGRLRRVHGGAQRRGLADEPGVSEKAFAHAAAKAAIAQVASTYVKAGMQVFLDAGTSTAQVIPLLTGRDVTVVTSGVDNAKLLADTGLTAIMLGGRIKPTTLAIVGAEAVTTLQRYRFDLAILGTNGIDENGATTPDPEEAATKRLAIARADHALILADASKFGQRSFAQFAELPQAQLITESIAALPAQYRPLPNLKEAQP